MREEEEGKGTRGSMCLIYPLNPRLGVLMYKIKEKNYKISLKSEVVIIPF